MIKNTIVYFIFCFNLLHITKGQENVKITGRIYDAKSYEALSYSNVVAINQDVGTTTDVFGNYSLVVNKGKINLKSSFIGYQSDNIVFFATGDTVINIYLQKGIKLSEYIVYANNNAVINSQHVGSLSLPIKDIEFAPSVGGESNLIASLKTLPGVSAGKEGNSELNVRGGRFDQNLILLDEVPVYNINHSFGLLSLFNSTTIKSVVLHKGAIPVSYGGRLSSVLRIATKEGNKKEIKGCASVSTVATSLMLEGPIIKDKTSFLLSMRRSWPDLLVRVGSEFASSDFVPILYFMDINAKINHQFNENNHLYVSYYTGRDKLGLMATPEENYAESNQGWGNNLFSTRFYNRLKNGMNLNSSVYYTRFYEFAEQKMEVEGVIKKQTEKSHMAEFGVKLYLSNNINSKFKYDLGGELYRRIFEMPVINYAYGNLQNNYSYDLEKQNGGALFCSLDYHFLPFDFSAGVRMDIFKGSSKIYSTLQPRLALKYIYSNRLTFKTGMMTNVQSTAALHKANNGFPGYSWIPLTNEMKPQKSQQYSIGMHYKVSNRLYFDTEVYYKKT